MKSIRFVAVAVVAIVAAAVPAHSANVALLSNTSYVDYDPTASGSEASNVEAALVELGHTVTTFTDISASGFEAALAGQCALVIPELENGDLDAALDASARDVIADFVSSGGLYIGFDPYANNAAVINSTFGYSITSASASEPIGITGDATGTPFEGGPATIPSYSETQSITAGSVPAGALSIYTDDSGNSTVTGIEYGAGAVVVLGWDWYNAQPIGGNDGGWNDVLDRTISVCGLLQPEQYAIPTVGEIGLAIFAGLLALAGAALIGLRAGR